MWSILAGSLVALAGWALGYWQGVHGRHDVLARFRTKIESVETEIRAEKTAYLPEGADAAEVAYNDGLDTGAELLHLALDEWDAESN